MTEEILRLANDLNAPYLYERSFKLADHALYDQRLLISLRMAHLGPDPSSLLAHICDTLAVPAAHRKAIAAHLHEADNLHLGVEEGAGTCVYKLYLEFARKFRQALGSAGASCRPPLLHLAFKWEPREGGLHTIARYTGNPGWGVGEMQGRLAELYADSPGSAARRFAAGLLEKAVARVPAESLFFLTVEEDDNPRASFDLCVYDAGFTLAETEPEILALGRYFKLADDELGRLIAPIRQEKLGHFSGGVGRNGHEFCTLYYGVRRHVP
ncbi:hypothetical protein [Methylococcus sp. EFPC2]|uniref:hypothetical protein n=1 Tax=Methylococcus sp. EFPC2 TaxID=2812648 RepID=UPI001968753D|nr:hypothetical protein [Methylococcus sp. EFPC2]QSA98189.1 hypothetical protein JWZ97_05060 [Methylococcus sp. EFPC2]